MSVNVSAVTNHFPTANKGFITTTSSTITSGVAQTTVPLTSVSGLTNATIFVGILSPGTASEREFTGTVDTAGSQITGVKWTDGLDATHTAGTTIVDYVAATGQNMQTKGFLVAHDQDGTLKADSVDVTAVIKDGVITNAKLVDGTITEAKTNTKPSEFLADFIYSGGVVAQSAGLVGTFSNIVYYIAGVRYTATSVANKTYTASKDTYVDIGTDGVVDYNEVANGAASPALSASHIRVAKVVTNGSAITSVTQYGKENTVQIYPTDKTSGLFYQELARTTLTTAGDTITVSSIPAKKYLRILYSCPSSGSIIIRLRFNGDTGNYYERRTSSNGGADATVTAQPSIALVSTAAALNMFGEATVYNLEGTTKALYSHSVVNNSPPDRYETIGKWVNSAVITSVTIFNDSTGDFAAGSEVVVLGHD